MDFRDDGQPVNVNLVRPLSTRCRDPRKALTPHGMPTPTRIMNTLTLTPKNLDAVRGGLDYASYVQQWRAKNADSMQGLDPVTRRTRFYSRYNMERHERVEALWEPSDAYSQAVTADHGAAVWLFITEDWCVDSAYSLPLIHWGSEQRADVTLRILLRDESPEIMDLFLTEGKRSIPKFVGISSEGDVRFVWGPQPEVLRDIRQDLMANGTEGRIVSSTTVDWYAANGWLEVERELTLVLTEAATE